MPNQVNSTLFFPSSHRTKWHFDSHQTGTPNSGWVGVFWENVQIKEASGTGICKKYKHCKYGLGTWLT